MLEPWKFHVGASATTAADRIVYNPTSGDLFYDADGTGVQQEWSRYQT